MPVHEYDQAAPVPPGYDNPAAPHVYDNGLIPRGYDNPHVYDNGLIPRGYDNPHVYDNVGGGSPEAAVAAVGHYAEEPAPLTNRDRIQNRIVKTKNQDAHGQNLSWVTDDHGPLHGRAKGDKYGGAFPEDKVLGFRAPAHKPELKGLDYGVTTKYANDAEREAMRVRQGDGGLLEDASSNLKNGRQGWAMSPDTGAMHTFDDVAHIVDPHTGANISETRDIYGDAKRGHKVKTNHHSTALAGGAVAGAGFAEFDHGSLATVSDDSGHYTPEAEYTHQAVRQMANSGMSMQRPGSADGEDGLLSTRVKLGGYDAIRGAGKSWIEEHNAAASSESDKMDDGVLSLPYQAFLTSHGNERQMRLKSTLNKQIGGAATKMAGTRAADRGISTDEALGNHMPEVAGTRPEPIEPADVPSHYLGEEDGDDDEPNPLLYSRAAADENHYAHASKGRAAGDENLYAYASQGGAAAGAYPLLDD